MRILRSLVIAAAIGAIFLAILFFVSPARFLQATIAAERAAAQLDDKQIDAAGFHIAYLDSGGNDEPLVLVHGFGADKDAWNRVARTLSRHYRIVALDLPGFGESSSPTDAHYDIDEQAERLHVFVQRIGLTHEHLGGFSMGGAIVTRMAARYPNEVGSLWLIGSAGFRSPKPSVLQQTLERGDPNPLVLERTQDYGKLLAFVMEKPPYIPGSLLPILAQRELGAHELRMQQFRELSAGAPLDAAVDGLPIPTHILWGREDRAVDASTVETIRHLLPDSSATILPGIGHLPMLEAPDEAAADYLRFRESVKYQQPVRPDHGE